MADHFYLGGSRSQRSAAASSTGVQPNVTPQLANAATTATAAQGATSTLASEMQTQIIQGNASQTQLSQCLGRLLALISHELSNPLQSLTMLVELALDETNDPTRLQQRLGQGLQAAQELRQVVRDITDYASASLIDQPQTCAQIVGRALSLVRRRLTRHDVRVTSSYGPLEYIAVPGPLHSVAVLHTLLAIVQTLASSRMTAFELNLHGRLGDVPDDPHETRAAVLDFRLSGHLGGSSWVSVPVSVEPLRLHSGEWLVYPVERTDTVHSHVIEVHFFAPLQLGHPG